VGVEQERGQDATLVAGCPIDGKGEHGADELASILDARAVAQCVAGTASDRCAFVCWCQARFEPNILRAMSRRGARYRDLAHDGFQDLCCALLNDPTAVLRSFPASRVALNTYLTRWVGRRVWVIMHRFDRCERRRPLVYEPEALDSRSTIGPNEHNQAIAEKARTILGFLTKSQRHLVESLLLGNWSIVVEKLSPGALRKTLYRIRRRLRDVSVSERLTTVQ
jgi:hypothetical protein